MTSPVPDVSARATSGPVTLGNRTVKAATCAGRTEKGQATGPLIDLRGRQARGGAATGTRRVPSTEPARGVVRA